MRIKRLIAVAMAMVMVFSCTAFGAPLKEVRFTHNVVGANCFLDGTTYYEMYIQLKPKDADDKKMKVSIVNETVHGVANRTYKKSSDFDTSIATVGSKDCVEEGSQSVTLTADKNGSATVYIHPKKVGSAIIKVECGDLVDARYLYVNAPKNPVKKEPVVDEPKEEENTVPEEPIPEQPKEVETDRFSLKRDTWPVPNTHEGFSYAENYTIPWERYEEVYGPAAKEIYEVYGDKLWTGNCVGLCLTAVLNHMGIIELPVRGDLSKNGYDRFDRENKIVCFDEDSELTKIIERYLLLQRSTEYDVYCLENRIDVKKIENAVLRGEPILIGIHGDIVDEGQKKYIDHEVVMDCTDPTVVEKISPILKEKLDPDNKEFTEEGWYRVRVYDPNIPYTKKAMNFIQENIANDLNRSDETYYYFNTDTEEWKYDLRTYKLDSNPMWINTTYNPDLVLIDKNAKDTKELFGNTYKHLASAKDKCVLESSAENMEIKDKKGNTVVKVEGGEITKNIKNWFLRFFSNASVVGDKQQYIVSGPIGDYEVTFSDGAVSARFNDNMNFLVTDGAATFGVNSTNDAVSVTAEENCNVKIIQQNIFDPETYTTARLIGDMKTGQTVDVSLDDSDNFSVSASEGLVMDMEVESTKSKNKEFKAEDVVLGDAEYALQDVLNGKVEVTSQPVKTPAEQPSQPDVSDDDKPAVEKDTTTASGWAKSTLDLAYEAGIVPALTGDPAFKAAITREQFAELAVAMVSAVCGRPELTGEKTFSDCINPDVLLAAEMGIVSGVGNGKFDPKTTTNREQIATMVNNAINYINKQKGIDLTPSASDISKFADKDKVSGWAKESVGALAANGIMSGTSTTTLSPKDSCTVEQSIMLLYRVYEAAK